MALMKPFKIIVALAFASSVGMAQKFQPGDVVHLEMRSKRLTLSASKDKTRFQVTDKETQLTGRKLDRKTLQKNFPKLHELLDRSVAPLLATR